MSVEKSYLLYLDSRDKISGKNNDANFNINWDSFLPRKYTQYEVSFLFQSVAGNYSDSGRTNNFITAEVKADFTNNSETYDTGTHSKSSSLGFIRRNLQSTFCDYSSIFEYNPKKVIGIPNQNLINIKIINLMNSLPLYDNQGVYTSTVAVTNTSGTTLLTATATPTGVLVGQLITGTGIQANTTVTNVNGLSITISKATTVNVTSCVVTIENVGPGGDMTNWNMVMKFNPILD
jgi:hypothetical protein